MINRSGTITIACAGAVLCACDVEQTQRGALPDVDVDVDAGALPEFEVDWADVNVGTQTEVVTVPRVAVVMEQVEVEVPFIDIDMPNEASEAERRTVAVEVEVAGEMHKIDIEEVYARDRRLTVVSKLEPTGEPLDDQRVRVSDRLSLNAPDLDVRHIIVGDKPQGYWNEQYVFVDTEAEARRRIGEGARLIYSD